MGCSTTEYVYDKDGVAGLEQHTVMIFSQTLARCSPSVVHTNCSCDAKQSQRAPLEQFTSNPINNCISTATGLFSSTVAPVSRRSAYSSSDQPKQEMQTASRNVKIEKKKCKNMAEKWWHEQAKQPQIKIRLSQLSWLLWHNKQLHQLLGAPRRSAALENHEQQASAAPESLCGADMYECAEIRGHFRILCTSSVAVQGMVGKKKNPHYFTVQSSLTCRRWSMW